VSEYENISKEVLNQQVDMQDVVEVGKEKLSTMIE
jgi:hypothetical protein